MMAILTGARWHPIAGLTCAPLMASDQERLEGGSAFGPPAGSGGLGSSWLLPILLVLGPPGCERLGVHLGPKRL